LSRVIVSAPQLGGERQLTSPGTRCADRSRPFSFDQLEPPAVAKDLGEGPGAPSKRWRTRLAAPDGWASRHLRSGGWITRKKAGMGAGLFDH